MDPVTLSARREWLRTSQNPDGGWGYFAGKQSWLEPTAYAILALHGDAASEPAAAKAWALVKTLQAADGGFKPAAHLDGATWVTALAVLLCTAREEYGRTFERGVHWLLRSSGAENAFLNRLVYRIAGRGIGRDTSNRGWPWRPDTTAWVEPTAHSLIALKKASQHYHDRELAARVQEGEALLLTVRSRDGGWNYGSASALGVDLPSYPETTALALLGLQRSAPEGFRLSEPGTRSRLADAWIAIAARVLGIERPFLAAPDPPADLMIAALEALAMPGGNAMVFKADTA